MICSGVWGARWEYTFNFQGLDMSAFRTISKTVPSGETKVPRVLLCVSFTVQPMAIFGRGLVKSSGHFFLLRKMFKVSNAAQRSTKS